MAASKSSLTSLLQSTTLEDHDQLLHASEIALKASKSDAQAQHVKVVALLKLERYEDAVSFIESYGEELQRKVGLEYAYALYKVGKLEDAARVASESTGKRGAQHIEAQARYKLEEFTKTAQIYQEIRQNSVSKEDYDIRINQGAIDAQGQWLGILDTATARRPGREDLEAFETAYNAACGSIARGEFAQAEMLLKRAKELCKHSEEFTEEQKSEELLPISVQQVYVFHQLGKSTEAGAVADEITVEAISDLATRRIAASNLLLYTAQDANPFFAHKAFNSTPDIPARDQLFSYQSIPLTSNEKTIDLNSYKFTALIESTKKQLSKLPTASTSPEALLSSAFNAAAHARNEAVGAAIRNVLPEVKRRPKDIGLHMTLVQMHVLTGNTTSAIELMESLVHRLEESTVEHEQRTRYHPGLVSILIGLYRHQGRSASIKQELAKAASYWRTKSNAPVTLLHAAGLSFLDSSSPDDAKNASEIFTRLYDQQPKDKATLAGYIASHALSDPESVINLASNLTSVATLVSNINVDAIEAAGVPQSTNALAIAQATSRPNRKRTATSTQESEKKRIRPSRLPKDFDPSSNAKPDPERWLPKRDRSGYRPPKGKKKGKKGDDRTQGGVVSEDLDVTKREQKGSEVVSANTGGNKSKKKGKGKK